ncbi:hypothetical protein [Chakrabartyella piscis]|uniref:hypothetical protein n=1 Tax=Chakrabartyella piscis TaxID=2918914 RepID=UPI002958A8C8|nr:hypothetical protein [Chakrabartyella piscis]
MNAMRTNIWIDEKLLKTMNLLVEKEDMKNQSEFVNRAIEFYSGYLLTQNATKFISNILIGEMQGAINSCENRLHRRMVENEIKTDMILNVLRFAYRLSREELETICEQIRNEGD